MKKKILSFMTVLVLLFSMLMTAYAEGDSGQAPLRRQGGTAAELKSYGRIVYQKGSDTIKIDSDDLYMLAAQIDQVKLDIVKQLEVMNTYFTVGEGISLTTSSDINVTHAEPYEEDFVAPLDINFDTLLEGIAISQSISQEPSEYGYPEGTILYKTKEGLLTDTFEDDAQEIAVTSATADNLSAGTAAWVNGRLILGTGADSGDYYKQGQYDEALKGEKVVQSFDFKPNTKEQIFVITEQVSNPKALVVVDGISVTIGSDSDGYGQISTNVNATISDGIVVTLSPTQKFISYPNGNAYILYSGRVIIVESN